MPTILHFADAHIDIANYGRHDPQSGLPVRVLDFLKSLDTIIDTAIDEKVDLVLFAGDAYKDRSPAPTFQREWGRRIMRLSRAGIPTLLLVGNHDLSPALGRAHAMETFDTLEVPHIRVVEKPAFFGPEDLEGLPLQVIALPWISRSGLVANLDLSASAPEKIYEDMEIRLKELVDGWLEKADPSLPMVLTAHASVQGAKYGGERSVMLGGDLVLSGSLVRDPRLDYVALGHIHLKQDLNENAHPPVVYPGSIERVDFGEWDDDKYFVIAHIQRNQTELDWRKLEGIRPFISRSIILDNVAQSQSLNDRVLAALPPPEEMDGAVVRLTITYPREYEAMIDEASLREYTRGTFEFHLVKRPLTDARIRLPADQAVNSLTPQELLQIYWLALHADASEIEALSKLAETVISDAHQESQS